LPSHRRSTILEKRSTASESTSGLKTVELEQRLSRLEICCRDMADTMDLLLKRTTALQAQLDHISAKLGR